MKKYSAHIFTAILMIGIFVPFHAHAEGAVATVAGWFGLPTPMDMLKSLLGAVLVAILWTISWLLYFAGMLLNFVLNFTIVDMKVNLAKLVGINTVWKTIRDMMNILFIFFLLYEAIKLIIGLSDTQKIGKFVAWLVLSALLINFSLFFTKVLIDASNVVTIGIYNELRAPTTANPDRGISDEIMDRLGIQSIYSSEKDTTKVDFGANKGIGAMLIYGFGSILLIFVATFVFFSVSMVFIIRYMTLLILLMLSPIAFMGMAFPFMKTYADDWWKALNSQLLFAPFYMIFTWMVISLMGSGGFINSGPINQVFDTTTSLKNVPGAFGKMELILNFIVLIGLLIASLILAKKTSSQGSQYIGQATGKLTSFAGSAVMGSAAAAGRKTFGAAANARANNEELKDRAAKGSRWAQLQLKTARGVASSSFDARSSYLGGTIAKATGVDLGKGTIFNEKAGKDGYKKELEERIKKETKYAESLKPSDKHKEDLKKKVEAEEGAKVKEAEKAVNDNVKEIDEKIEERTEKEKLLNSNFTSESEKSDLRMEIAQIDEQIAFKKEEGKKLAKAVKDADEEHKKKIGEIEKIYENRVEAYATTIEKGGFGGFMSRYGSTLARIGTGATLGFALGGPVGAVIGGVHQAATAQNVPAVNRGELASKIRAVKKKKSGLSKDEKKNLRKKIKEGTKEEKAEAWKKLDEEYEDDEDDGEETPPTPKPETPTNTT